MTRATRWMPLLCAALAFAVRAGALVHFGGLRGVVDYDDGVYLSAAQHLLAGRLPYRDFVFLHPPGSTIALLPFAGLAHLAGDSWALAVARLSFAAVGAVNAGLVAALLRRYGLAAALAGGGLYAGWNATTGAETTVMLEPLLNLALLLTLVLLRRPSSLHATAAIGVVAGAAVAVKLWAVGDVLALLAVLALTAGRRRALSWFAGAVAGAVLLIVPFAATSPGRTWRYLVTDQFDRPADGVSMVDRLRYFDAVTGRRFVDSASAHLVLAVAALALAAVVYVAVRSLVRERRQLDEPGWWALLALERVSVLAAGPSFYYHYTAFAAAPLCLLAGYGIGQAVARLRPVAGRVVLAVVLGALGLVTGVGLARFGVERVERGPLVAFALRHRCVWAPDYQLLELSDVATRDIARGCPGWVDQFGVALDGLAGTGTVTTTAAIVRSDRYQADVRGQLAGSDALILSPGTAFSSATRAYLRTHFVLVQQVGDDQLLTRKTGR